MKQLTLVFFLFINSLLALNAQSKDAILIHQTFISKIGSICEETPDDNPCAGLEIHLILKFTKDNLSIIEKEISSCDEENISSRLSYKWKLTQNSEIKIDTNPQEIEYHFLKDLVLKIEDEKVIGYKKQGIKKMNKFEFNRVDAK